MNVDRQGASILVQSSGKLVEKSNKRRPIRCIRIVGEFRIEVETIESDGRSPLDSGAD